MSRSRSSGNREFHSGHIPCNYRILHVDDIYRTIGYQEPEERRQGMAQKVQTLLIDDLDGDEAEGTVRFGLDGAQYEIDLSTDHAEELRRVLASYARAGRKVTGTARRAGRAQGKPAANGFGTHEVRDWAKANGVEIKERGLVPDDDIAKFHDPTARQRVRAATPVRHQHPAVGHHL